MKSILSAHQPWIVSELRGNSDPGYEAEQVAGVRTMRRHGIITKYSSGPLVVPSVVAAMKAAVAEPEEELEEGSGDDDEELPDRTNADINDDELPD